MTRRARSRDLARPRALYVKVAPATVRQILKDAGTDPVSDPGATTWAAFLRSQGDARHARHRLWPGGSRWLDRPVELSFRGFRAALFVSDLCNEFPRATRPFLRMRSAHPLPS